MDFRISNLLADETYDIRLKIDYATALDDVDFRETTHCTTDCQGK